MSSVIKPAIIDGDGDLELSVQDHLISQPLAEVGIRNSGKSYQAGKICEQLCEIKQPFIVIDPEGEYYKSRFFERFKVPRDFGLRPGQKQLELTQMEASP